MLFTGVTPTPFLFRQISNTRNSCSKPWSGQERYYGQYPCAVTTLLPVTLSSRHPARAGDSTQLDRPGHAARILTSFPPRGGKRCYSGGLRLNKGPLRPEHEPLHFFQRFNPLSTFSTLVAYFFESSRKCLILLPLQISLAE